MEKYIIMLAKKKISFNANFKNKEVVFSQFDFESLNYNIRFGYDAIKLKSKKVHLKFN